MNKKQSSFTTQSITTAAAILSNDSTKLLKVTDDGFKKTIHIIPFEEAQKLYEQLLDGSLMISAQKNGFWVEQLKAAIFRNKERGEI